MMATRVNQKAIRLSDVVYDRWWVWKLGKVVQVLKTRLKVMWSDGRIDTYDKPHQQFLERLVRERKNEKGKEKGRVPR